MSLASIISLASLTFSLSLSLSLSLCDVNAIPDKPMLDQVFILIDSRSWFGVFGLGLNQRLKGLGIDWKGNASIEHNHQEEARVGEWLVREGGAVLCSFLLLLVARCLLAWSLSCLVYRVSCVRASYLHLFGLSSLEVGHLFVVVCEREREWKRWETFLLIVMLESSSRYSPRNDAIPMG